MAYDRSKENVDRVKSGGLNGVGARTRGGKNPLSDSESLKKLSWRCLFIRRLYRLLGVYSARPHSIQPINT